MSSVIIALRRFVTRCTRFRHPLTLLLLATVIILCCNVFALHRSLQAPGLLVVGGRQKHVAPDVPDCHRSYLSLYHCISSGYCCWNVHPGSNEIQPAFSARNRYPHVEHMSALSCLSGITIVYMACGEHSLDDIVVSIKSLLLFTFCHVNLKVIVKSSEKESYASGLDELLGNSGLRTSRVSYAVLEMPIPPDGYEKGKTSDDAYCTSAKFFLPQILEDTDAAIVLAPASIFFSPVEEMWHLFSQMKKSQFVAMSREHEDPDLGWYNKEKNVPYVPPLGVNSGVILMNLTRMRASEWSTSFLDAYERYKERLLLGDQDLFNAMLAHKTEWFMELPCTWNYRPHHCFRDYCNCKTARPTGFYLLQGINNTFHRASNSEPFYNLYDLCSQVSLDDTDAFSTMKSAYREYLKRSKETGSLPCDKIYHRLDERLDTAPKPPT